MALLSRQLQRALEDRESLNVCAIRMHRAVYDHQPNSPINLPTFRECHANALEALAKTDEFIRLVLSTRCVAGNDEGKPTPSAA